jgi:hypothetical protein
MRLKQIDADDFERLFKDHLLTGVSVRLDGHWRISAGTHHATIEFDFGNGRKAEIDYSPGERHSEQTETPPDLTFWITEEG